MKTEFPVINNTDFITINGKFYKQVAENEYRLLELYLPCATGTYNEPLEMTAERWLNELSAGTRTPRWGVGSTGCTVNTRYKWENGRITTLNPVIIN